MFRFLLQLLMWGLKFFFGLVVVGILISLLGSLAPLLAPLPFMPPGFQEFMWAINTGITTGEWGQSLPGKILSATGLLTTVGDGLGAQLWKLFTNPGLILFVVVVLVWYNRSKWREGLKSGQDGLKRFFSFEFAWAWVLLIGAFYVVNVVRTSGGVTSLPRVTLPIIVIIVLAGISKLLWGRVSKFISGTIMGALTGVVVVTFMGFLALAGISSTGYRFNIFTHPTLAKIEATAYTFGAMADPEIWGVVALVAGGIVFLMLGPSVTLPKKENGKK